jgi:hypothetical protein
MCGTSVDEDPDILELYFHYIGRGGKNVPYLQVATIATA